MSSFNFIYTVTVYKNKFKRYIQKWKTYIYLKTHTKLTTEEIYYILAIKCLISFKEYAEFKQKQIKRKDKRQ